MSDDLPNGWVKTTIEKVLAPLHDGRILHHGWSPQCLTGPSPTDEAWGVLKTTAIQSGRFLPEHNKALPEDLKPRPQIEVKQGDILLTCAGPRERCGVACLVRETRPRLMVSGKMYRFRARIDLVDSRFLEAQLLSQAAKAAIDAMKTGISDSGLNLTHDRFKQLPITVAPLAEQPRIVAAIETSFSRLDAAAATLGRVQRNLERYRASVLKAAVEGRLVPTEAELAKKERRSYEPASALLKRILAERRRRWEGAELAKLKTKGKPPTDDRWKARYEEPVTPDTSCLRDLPEGWCWATVDQLAATTQIGLVRAQSEQGRHLGFGYVRMDQIDSLGGLDLSSHRTARVDASDEEVERFALRDGDLLFNTRNSAELVGKTALVVSPPPRTLFNNNIMRIRAADGVSPRFLANYFLSRLFRDQIERVKKATTSVAAVYARDLLPCAVALPPVEEQVRAAREVDRVLSEAAHASTAIRESTVRAKRLRQSILKWAFEGRLVDQAAPTATPESLLPR